MKNKKLLVLISALLVCASISSCFQSTGDNSQTDISDTVTETDGDTDNTDSENQMQVVSVGKTVTVDDEFEFTITNAEYTDDVMPQNPGQYYYNHYAAPDGKKYLDVAITYKNITGEDVSAYKLIESQLLYDEKYNYEGELVMENDERSSMSSGILESISPLSSAYFHCMFEVPDEVANGTASVYVGFQFGTTNETIYVIGKTAGSVIPMNIKNGTSTETDSGENQNTNQKVETVINTGETITTENCEFNVVYCDITDDVVPPNPDFLYSHYQADNGMVYVDICLTYKNIAAKKADADEVMSGKLKYADKYEYNGTVIIEEEDRSDLGSTLLESIAPLTTRYMHILFKVPSEVETSAESVVAYLKIDGNSYKIVVK